MAYDLKDEESVKEYIENLGIEYRFSCYHEKRPDGCHLLGDYLEAIKKDFQKAAIVYKSNCDDYQFGKSCYKYGVYNHLGKGCGKNTELALKYFEKGCHYNSPEACFLAGVMLTTTDAKHKNNLKGLNYLEKGCHGGNGESCYFASGMYIKGNEEVASDMKKAFEFAMKGCDRCHPQACANLSQMYKKGDGTTVNMELSERFRKLAMEMQEQRTKDFRQIKFGE